MKSTTLRLPNKSTTLRIVLLVVMCVAMSGVVSAQELPGPVLSITTQNILRQTAADAEDQTAAGKLASNTVRVDYSHPFVFSAGESMLFANASASI